MRSRPNAAASSPKSWPRMANRCSLGRRCSEFDNRHASMDQPQREATFDFLVLAMFADSNLKLKEDEQLYQLAHELGWDSPRNPEEYSKLATARVRAAVEGDGGIEPFLA